MKCAPVWQELSAAEAQGRHRPARRQLRRSLLPGHRPAGRLPQLRRDRLQSSRRRRHGHDARAGDNLPRPRPAHGLRAGRPGAGRGAGDRRPSTAISANARDRKRLASEILRRRSGAWKNSKGKSNNRLGIELPPPEPDEVWDIDDHLGWHEQGDGRWFYGLHVPAGRIQDTSETRLKTALGEICEGQFAGDLSHARPKPAAGRHLLGRPAAHRRAPPPLRRAAPGRDFQRPPLGQWPASRCPRCPLALTESERALPEVLRQLEGEVRGLDFDQEVFALRMTGCTNGCSQPYNADIGIVGRAAGRYGIYLGGRRTWRPARFSLSRRRAAGAARGGARARA